MNMSTQISRFTILILFFSQLALADQISQIGMSLRAGDGLPSTSNLEGVSGFNPDSSSFYSNLNSATQGSSFEPKVLRGATSINVYRKGAFGTVLVVTKDGVGSGIVLTNKAHILTNQHVVGKNKKVLVFFKKNSSEKISAEDGIEASVVKVDEVSDLALLHVPNNLTPKNMRPVPIADQEAEVGSDAHAIGHPSNQLWTYTRGYVSQIRNNFKWKEVHMADVLQIQTPINPGNSGGPLLNSDGELIGVNSFKDMENDAMNYAIGKKSITEFLFRSGSRYAEVRKKCEGAMIGKPVRVNDEDDGPTTKRYYDLNCDGEATVAVNVPDDESKAIWTQIDSNGDGEIDILLFDKDRDGKPEYSIIDSNHDGKADKQGIHTSGDIIPDRYESIG
jgi:S1-C subfamily serine protease